MRERTRTIAGGAVIGALAAGIFALPSILPPAIADEEPVRTLLNSSSEIFRAPLDGDDFFKPDWTVEPWVATEALSETTVRKIGYGRTEFVSVVRTATGTYSSDGLASKHIRYPGIVENSERNSFYVHVRHEGGGTVVRDGSVCSYGGSRNIC